LLKRLSLILALGSVLVAGLLVSPASADTITTTPNGTWDAYPGQSASYQTSIQPPINANGSSNYKATSKAVIPVKFGLSQGTGPLAFESIGSDVPPANDFSFLSFTPSSALTFNGITELSSVYAFTQGDCHDGSLRWQVRTDASHALFIYYGSPPQFGAGGTGGCTPTSVGGVDQSGSNLVGLSDLRYDTTQYVGGTFYDTYAHAQTLMGSLPVVRTSLVLDSGWAGDQKVTVTSATVKTAAFTDTFTPQPSGLTPVCPTQEASILITKTDGSSTGDVNEAASIQPADNNGIFRIVDCKYMYNLATTSLRGVGTYKVSAIINGVTASNPASFDLK
jgi:hypothetical protein